jgi:endo-beta-N-acetylglucosaminidase D
LKKITLMATLFCGSAFAQIINTAPYILTVDELKAWTQNGPTASTDLISTVPLATRFTNQSTQFNPDLTNDMQIAYLPDGMNNFGNYFGEQNQFNLYNFTHWAYLDKFVWFGGTSSQSVQIPSSPWTNVAHKNGVKMFGNVFFSPTAFGGSTATLQNFLEQDGNGNFIAVPKMIALMQYYNFDGWFINEETATTATIAAVMQDFVRDLTTAAEAVGKEVMWYDAMRLSGAVGWQNRLNVNNSPLVQDDQDGDGSFETRVSSSIFINFFWGSNAFPTQSRARATTIGRSQFDVFTGADIWPGRNQGNFETNGNQFMGYLHENATTPFTSLGLFASNCIYNNSVYSNFNNDPDDYEAFYSAENHMFGGLDRNPALVDATGFKGFCNWVPEASVITNNFQTNFSTGHGMKKFDFGTQTSGESWHNMNEQNILPTWQWAFSQNGLLEANWDFNDAFSGGNSLKVSGNLPANNTIDLMLFKSKIEIAADEQFPQSLDLYYKCSTPVDSKMKLIVVFADDVTQKIEFPISPFLNPIFNGWAASVVGMPTGNAGREVAQIGLRFYSESAVPDYSVNIGEFAVSQSPLGINEKIKSPNFVAISYPENGSIIFNLNWPNATKVDYQIFDVRGKALRSNEIILNKITTYNFDTSGISSGTYIVKFTDAKNVSETKKLIIR